MFFNMIIIKVMLQMRNYTRENKAYVNKNV
jgi:hypothetical protein